MRQGNWPLIRSKTEPGGYLPAEIEVAGAGTWDCSTWNKSLFQKLKYGTGSSPTCDSIFVKSIDRRSSRGGVPFFSRPSSSPNSCNEPDRLIAAASPARPPFC